MAKPYPLEAQVYLTRECNLRCDYCILTKSCMKELSLAEWKLVFSALDSIGIESVKLLGGEPTVKPWLEDLLFFIATHTSIRCALLSNSSFSEERMHSLIGAGLWGYFASVDAILPQTLLPGADHTDIKASHGYYMLHKLKSEGLMFLGANVVIRSDNILEIPDLVAQLSSEGFWVNLCPIIWGNGNGKVTYEYRAADSIFKLTDFDKLDLQKMVAKLLSLKSTGAKIIATDSYIKGLLTRGVLQNWHCSRLAQLRIDADGSIMCCPDIRGHVSKRYKVWDLIDPKEYEQLIHAEWQKDSSICTGCYWSSIFLAEENQKNNRADFWYL